MISRSPFHRRRLRPLHLSMYKDVLKEEYPAPHAASENLSLLSMRGAQILRETSYIGWLVVGSVLLFFSSPFSVRCFPHPSSIPRLRVGWRRRRQSQSIFPETHERARAREKKKKKTMKTTTNEETEACLYSI